MSQESRQKFTRTFVKVCVNVFFGIQGFWVGDLTSRLVRHCTIVSADVVAPCLLPKWITLPEKALGDFVFWSSVPLCMHMYLSTLSYSHCETRVHTKKYMLQRYLQHNSFTFPGMHKLHNCCLLLIVWQLQEDILVHALGCRMHTHGSCQTSPRISCRGSSQSGFV